MSMAQQAHTVPKALPLDKFSVDKTTNGGLTILTMRGTVNDGFEGRKIADSVGTKKLIVNMRDVRRFASWGMAEWMEFLRINGDCDLYLVECSTYAVSQINLVTGLLGHGKLVSFYASFRCGSCSEELETLFVIPSDREAIRALPGSTQECTTCGGRARLEEYAASFFDTIANRPSFDIDDEVLAYLRGQYKYDITQDLTRFRAFRAQQQNYTYLRLSGSLQLLAPDVLAAASEGTTVVDLANVIFNPADTTAWRTYLQEARGKVASLQLLDCPPGFLEGALTPEDLRDKVKVRTFALAYDCVRCETTTIHMVDVAANLEFLVEGSVPPAHCSACRSELVAAPTPAQLERFRGLPARARDATLDKVLAKARSEPIDRLENCLTTRDDAAAEATDAALEELVSAISLKISDAHFREQVLPGFSGVRQKAMLALQSADTDRTSAAYATAVESVRKARKRVAELLQASGGAAVPAQRSDWYWEEYADEKGKPNEMLVFVRYDIPLDAVRTLVDTYSTTSAYKGTAAMTVFPALAWRDAELTGGALLTKVGKPLADAGVAPRSIVTAIGDQPVSDAAGFTRRLEEAFEASGDITLTVKTGDTAPQTVRLAPHR